METKPGTVSENFDGWENGRRIGDDELIEWLIRASVRAAEGEPKSKKRSSALSNCLSLGLQLLARGYRGRP